MSEPRPIHCVKCERDFVPEKNGVYLIEMAWHPRQPYKVWYADLWKCPGCGTEIIRGYSQEAIYHHEQNFEDYLNRARNSGRCYANYENGIKE